MKLHQKLHHLLEEIEMPADEAQRADYFSRQFGIKRHVARAILSGRQKPDADLLQRIAEEFETTPDALAE